MKRIVVLILSLTMIITLFKPLVINADGNDTLNADLLNQINILQGDGHGYNLQGSLKRSEAITFVARLMGKEAAIIANKQGYSQTHFSDVSADAWYAPYVGFFVDQKIVNGFSDGTFRPNDVISEKAFLLLALGALGYTSSSDFTWSTLYTFAYEKGLVTDVTYKNKIEDNTKYLRSGAVNILTNALTAKLNHSDTTLVANLIASGFIDAAKARSLGLIRDILPSAITSVQANNDQSVTIHFNEAIKSVNDIKIYEADHLENSLAVTTNQVSVKSIVVQTDKQKPQQSYTVVVSHAVDLDGNTIDSLKSNFNGFLETKADSIISLSNSKIKITFNQNINAVKPEDIEISEGNNKLMLTIESQSAKELVVQTSQQQEDAKYTVSIHNVSDLAGNVTTVSGPFNGFKIPEVKSDFFKISKIVAESKNLLDVYFTQPITGNTAAPYYYEILKGGSSYIKGDFNTLSVHASLSQPNLIRVYLKNNVLGADASYSLKISGEATGLYGIKLNEGAGESATISTSTNDNAPLSILGVTSIDSKTIRVDFNKELDYNSTSSLANYSLTSAYGSSRSIIKTVITGDGASKGKVLLLGISGTFDKNVTYDLNIKNVMDVVTQSTIADIKYPFNTQAAVDPLDVQIVNATAMDQNTIQVYFNKPLDYTAANANLYSVLGVSQVGYIVTPISIYYDPAIPYKVTLIMPTQNSLVNSNTYKLRMQAGIQDQMGNMMLTSIESNINGSGDTNVKPLFYQAQIIGKDTILLRANKPIINSGANVTTSNYTLEYTESATTKSKSPNSVSMIDAYTMVMKVDGLDYNIKYNVKFNMLTDYSGAYIRTSADGLTSIGVDLGK